MKLIITEIEVLFKIKKWLNKIRIFQKCSFLIHAMKYSYNNRIYKMNIKMKKCKII